MAKDKTTGSDGMELEAADRILQITVAANQIAAGDWQANPYEMRNALLETRRLARVRYKNGVTLPASAAKLRADAGRNVRHSRILARNIRNATGEIRHAEADAHHIVARLDAGAQRSRILLFGWGIGINDADNGMYMPKKRTSKVPGLELSTAHENIHTFRYHLAVETRLRFVTDGTEKARAALRIIRSEILNDQFIY